MGNCQNQRHLNQNQANIIEAFLAFDGSDRTQLCEEIWNVASPKVDYYWRDGTFDALEELRTKELYYRTYGNGRGLWLNKKLLQPVIMTGAGVVRL